MSSVTTEAVRATIRRSSKVRTLSEISDAIGADTSERKFVSRALHVLSLRGEVEKYTVEMENGRELNGYAKPKEKVKAKRAAN